MLDLPRCWFYAQAAREGLCAEISRSCLGSCDLNTLLMGAAVLVPPSPRGIIWNALHQITGGLSQQVPGETFSTTIFASFNLLHMFCDNFI